MQNEVMKVLETRKQNTRTTLTVLPEKPLQDNSTLSLAVTQGLSHFGIHFHNLTPHIFTTVKQLSNLKADDFMDVTWADKSDLKKLYLLAKLLQAALKEKIAEYEKESQGTEGQKEAPTQVSVQFEVPVIRLKRYREEVKREKWFGKISSEREPFPGMGTEFPKAVIRQDAEQQDSLDLHRGTQSRQKKLAWSLEHQSAASLLRPQRGVFQSSGKRSVSEAVTGAPSLTASIVMDENAADDLTGRVVIILKHSKKLRKPINEVFQPTVRKQEEETSGSQQAPSESPPGRSSDTENTEDLVSGNTPSGENSENLLPGNKPDSQTLQKDQEFLRLMQKENKPQMPAAGTGTLNELSPDITLSQDTRWEHHEQPTTASPQATSLQSGGDYLLQGSLFEAEVNKRLEPLIPNVPVRNLISHVIRILKMDCTKPDIQMACAKLISKTGLLMKLFSDRENIKETYSLWQGGNMSTARPSNEGKPSDEISRQGILEYGYNSKLLLAISLTAVIMVIIAVICLIEICSHRSAKAREGTSDEKWSFLGRRKKSTPEKQSSVASSLDKPMWLEDMYRPVDNTQRKSMVDKLHDADSSDEEDIFNRASARASLISEPPPMEKRSSIKIEAAAPPPPPEEPLVKKASSKKLAPPPPAAAEPPPSEEATGEASSPKTAPSGDEGSEGTEGTSKKPSSEEEEEEEEED
uniref:LRRC37A/B like protein 1 C-terminal domain-containing protein n=1 Tax=Pogona vitticeps TaxID=103695 RepID=A0A6J0UIJ6_9SAUR